MAPYSGTPHPVSGEVTSYCGLATASRENIAAYASETGRRLTVRRVDGHQSVASFLYHARIKMQEALRKKAANAARRTVTAVLTHCRSHSHSHGHGHCGKLSRMTVSGAATRRLLTVFGMASSEHAAVGTLGAVAAVGSAAEASQSTPQNMTPESAKGSNSSGSTERERELQNFADKEERYLQQCQEEKSPTLDQPGWFAYDYYGPQAFWQGPTPAGFVSNPPGPDCLAEYEPGEAAAFQERDRHMAQDLQRRLQVDIASGNVTPRCLLSRQQQQTQTEQQKQREQLAECLSQCQQEHLQHAADLLALDRLWLAEERARRRGLVQARFFALNCYWARETIVLMSCLRRLQSRRDLHPDSIAFHQSEMPIIDRLAENNHMFDAMRAEIQRGAILEENEHVDSLAALEAEAQTQPEPLDPSPEALRELAESLAARNSRPPTELAQQDQPPSENRDNVGPNQSTDREITSSSRRLRNQQLREMFGIDLELLH